MRKLTITKSHIYIYTHTYTHTHTLSSIKWENNQNKKLKINTKYKSLTAKDKLMIEMYESWKYTLFLVLNTDSVDTAIFKQSNYIKIEWRKPFNHIVG